MAAPQQLLSILRRHRLASICGGVVVLLLAFLALRFGNLPEAEAQLIDSQKQADLIQRNLRNAAELDAHLAALKAGLVGLEEKLIRADALASNQQFIYKLESDSGVKLNRLQMVGPVRSAAAKTATLYRPVGFDVSVEGSFVKVLGFLRALEGGSRHYRLGSFSLQRSSTSGEAEANRGSPVSLSMNFELLGSQ